MKKTISFIEEVASDIESAIDVEFVFEGGNRVSVSGMARGGASGSGGEDGFAGCCLADDGGDEGQTGEQMKKTISFIEEVASDIESAIDFYDSIDVGAGTYFVECLYEDLETLSRFWGVHRVHFGLHRVRCSKFPFAIYYRDFSGIRQIAAVLDLRMDPRLLRTILSDR